MHLANYINEPRTRENAREKANRQQVREKPQGILASERRVNEIYEARKKGLRGPAAVAESRSRLVKARPGL